MNFITKTKRWIITLTVICVSTILISWGTFGHEHINRAAVMTLPVPLQTFFYNHIDFITQESTVPDLRKYTLKDKAENPRHYIDLENYEDSTTLPENLAGMKLCYEEKFLSDNGILPWYIQDVMEKLTNAFKEKKKTEILFLAGDLGHYIGDAYMPLHTSANYDGQETNQKGIHAFWESHLPELFGNNYNFNPGVAKFIPDVRKETWRIIRASHAQVNKLLSTEKELRKNFPPDNIYLKDSSGAIVKSRYRQALYSNEYSKAYHEKLNGMVQRQMRGAIVAVSSFWYTAWVNAGKPDVVNLDPQEVTLRNKPLLKQELDLLKKGKLFGVKSESEF